MSDLQFSSRTSAGSTTTLHAASIDALASSLDGTLLTFGSAGYDEARTLWNAMIDRHPALIAQCATARDVARCVDFARENEIILAIKGGGHNIAGNAMCEGGMVIDLSRMRGVDVDATTKTARVQGGALLVDVDDATQAHGLAVPLGINSTTGVAGLTLGGGFGWLSRRYGLTIDNLLSAEVVTANGAIVRASETENADLFWAIRGGGGNFGVVTEFEFALHDVGPTVIAGVVLYPISEAKRVLQTYRDYMLESPEELNCWFVMRKAPPAPFVPEEWVGREVVILAVCTSGPLDEAERLTRPLRDMGDAIVDIVGPMAYADFQKAFDAAQAFGARNYWKSHDFMGLTDGIIDTLIEFVMKLPDPNTDIAMARLGGAVARVPNDAMAYSHREATYTINIHGRWVDPANDDACIAWARGLWSALAPHSTGAVYVNFLTDDETDRVRNAYGANYDRLVAIKTKYDPTNLFRLNQNIRPATDAQVEGRG